MENAVTHIASSVSIEQTAFLFWFWATLFSFALSGAVMGLLIYHVTGDLLPGLQGVASLWLAVAFSMFILLQVPVLNGWVGWILVIERIAFFGATTAHLLTIDTYMARLNGRVERLRIWYYWLKLKRGYDARETPRTRS
jgi:hypothetical protein